MLKTDGATTSTPVLLVVAALSMFAVRCFMVSQEVAHPEKPQYQIAWNEVPLAGKNPDKKPVLFLFTSSAIAPCRELEMNTFTNRGVVELVEKNFFPVRVEDMGMVKKSNPAPVDEAEEKYHVREFPMLVVALPSGRSVADDEAIVRIRPVKDFLTDALRDVPYTEALDFLEQGEYDKAQERLGRVLEQADRNSASERMSPHWAAIDRYVCLRFLHKDADAEALLESASTKLSHYAYPYPILSFFKGDIDFEQLKEAARDEYYGRLEARAYAGLQQYFEGKDKEARENLKWAVAQKNMGDRIPVKLAQHALDLMDKQAAGGADEKAGARPSK